MAKKRPEKRRTASPAPPSPPAQGFWQKWWRRCAAAVAIIAVPASLYGSANLVRAIWDDTTPKIRIAGSDASEPFALPFTVINSSDWFAMRNVEYRCHLVDVMLSEGNRMSDVLIGFPAADIGRQRPFNFTCRINTKGRTLIRAKVVAGIVYKTLWFSREPATMEFNWISGRWVEGSLH